MLHAVVAVKQVPDTTNIRIDPDTGNLIRAGVPAILNPYDAHALAAAVEWKRKMGGKITVVSMGPQSFAASIRECIELGADEGILVSAREFAGADTLATSYVLAEAIKTIHMKEPVDLVFFGKQAIDGDTAQVGPGVACRLDMPIITYAVKIREVDLDQKHLIVERKTERWIEVLKAPLPAVLTCENSIAKIPYASLPDLVRSLRYEPAVWTFEGPVHFDRNLVGMKGSPTWVYKTGTPEPTEPGEVIHADEMGVEAAVKYALDKAKSAGIISSIFGGA